jgi:hypothetical protein
MGVEPGKVPIDREVKEGSFHRQIRQGESLLHATDGQHGLRQRVGNHSCALIGTGNEIDQRSLGTTPVHLREHLLLASPFWLPGSDFSRISLTGKNAEHFYLREHPARLRIDDLFTNPNVLSITANLELGGNFRCI